MSAPDREPGRATEFIRTVEWLGAPWRIGLALNERGQVWRLTIDPGSERLDIDEAAMTELRGGFTLISAWLPLGEEQLGELAREFADTPVGAALAAAARVQREDGARFAWLMARVRDRGAGDDAAAAEDAR